MKTFCNRVYEITKRIPKGRVATYGQIATAAGASKAARAVGVCMKRNPYAPIVPCHRVVAHNGALTGFSANGGIPAKKHLLENEGVCFVGERVDMHACQVDMKVIAREYHTPNGAALAADEDDKFHL